MVYLNVPTTIINGVRIAENKNNLLGAAIINRNGTITVELGGQKYDETPIIIHSDNNFTPCSGCTYNMHIEQTEDGQFKTVPGENGKTYMLLSAEGVVSQDEKESDGKIYVLSDSKIKILANGNGSAGTPGNTTYWDCCLVEIPKNEEVVFFVQPAGAAQGTYYVAKDGEVASAKGPEELQECMDFKLQNVDIKHKVNLRVLPQNKDATIIEKGLKLYHSTNYQSLESAFAAVESGQPLKDLDGFSNETVLMPFEIIVGATPETSSTTPEEKAAAEKQLKTSLDKTFDQLFAEKGVYGEARITPGAYIISPNQSDKLTCPSYRITGCICGEALTVTGVRMFENGVKEAIAAIDKDIATIKYDDGFVTSIIGSESLCEKSDAMEAIVTLDSTCGKIEDIAQTLQNAFANNPVEDFLITGEIHANDNGKYTLTLIPQAKMMVSLNSETTSFCFDKNEAKKYIVDILTKTLGEHADNVDVAFVNDEAGIREEVSV